MPGGGSITYLRLGHHSVLAVAQWGKVKALLLLLVPLLEELLHTPDSRLNLVAHWL